MQQQQQPAGMFHFVIPVSQHKLIKMSRRNRVKMVRFAATCALLAFAMALTSAVTNSWLYTSEVLKYWVWPNQSHYDAGWADESAAGPNAPLYFKNATIGPWLFCWLDPVTNFHCDSVDFWVDEDPSDVTASVSESTKRALPFLLLGVCLSSVGFLISLICVCRSRPFRSLLFATIHHILAGMSIMAAVVVYMSAVSKEVGRHIYPETEMDEPLFRLHYGYSFILLKASFCCTQLTAILTLLVYMAKRDERTFNRYKMRALLNGTALKRASVDGRRLFGPKAMDITTVFKDAGARRPSFDNIAFRVRGGGDSGGGKSPPVNQTSADEGDDGDRDVHEPSTRLSDLSVTKPIVAAVVHAATPPPTTCDDDAMTAETANE